jgi:hypothetical protein
MAVSRSRAEDAVTQDLGDRGPAQAGGLITLAILSSTHSDVAVHMYPGRRPGAEGLFQFLWKILSRCPQRLPNSEAMGPPV